MRDGGTCAGSSSRGAWHSLSVTGKERGVTGVTVRISAPWTRDLDSRRKPWERLLDVVRQKDGGSDRRLYFSLREQALLPDQVVSFSFFLFILLNPVLMHREMPDGGGSCLPQRNTPSKSCQNSLPRRKPSRLFTWQCAAKCTCIRICTRACAHTHTHRSFGYIYFLLKMLSHAG